MSKDKKNEESFSAVITKPDATPSDVKAAPMPPNATVGNLCTAFGDASFPSNVRIIGVYGLVKPGKDQAATPQEMTSPSPPARLYPMSGDGGWSFPSTSYPNDFLLATTGPNINDQADNTIIVATAYVNFMGGGTYQPTFEFSTKNFKGKKVAACSSVLSKAVVTSAAKPPESHPIDIDDGWLLYREIGVDFLGFGCTLMRHGSPLKARRLAMAASRICWTHGEGQSELVTRAIGNARTGHINSMFPDVSQNGLVLSQLSFAPTLHLNVRALVSECREHADVFSFDSTQPINVQVNFDIKETAARVGSFDLWVKVID